MLRSADIAVVYLAGPVAGILSADIAAFVASKALYSGLEQQVLVGASVAIGLNLFNLLPYEPLDGGLVIRALPYQALLIFPLGLAAWIVQMGLLETPRGALAVAAVTLIAVHRVNKWRRYAASLRARMDLGDATGLQEWQASFNVPLVIRLLVACVYGLTIVGGVAMFVNVASLAFQSVP
jgi:membrane-associated protease RseP (regulator of RpoE activity)